MTQLLNRTPGEESSTAAISDRAPEDYELVIQPRRGWIAVDWQELSHFRELLYFLIWRDVKVRYKQTVLGVAWAVLQPLVSMVIFTVVFGNLAGMKGQLPEPLRPYYAVFVLAGLIPWTFFSTGLSTGGLSLVSQQHLLTKIYFPRLFVPTSTVGGALVDLVLSYGVLVGMLIWYQMLPAWQVIFMPLFLLQMVLAALGVAYLLSALTVTYRDFRFIIPFMVQAWMWLSPVVYPVSIFGRYQWVGALNPMMGAIEGLRWSLFGPQRGVSLNGVNLTISALSTAVLFVFGLFYFRKTERRFADMA